MKLRWQIITACAALLSGIGLAIASFILNQYKIDATILWYIAQCFVYAGSMFGISITIDEKLKKITTQFREDGKTHQ